MITLSDLIRNLDLTEVRGNIDLPITGIHYDSRKIKPGFVFVCIEGYKTDGHKYVDNALEEGATAIVAQREVAVPQGITLIMARDTRKALAMLAAAFNGNPAGILTMIGVTGTNGKTTTTHLIAEIMAKRGDGVGLIGTIRNKIGDRELPVTNTTPESLELQALLREMVDSGLKYAVMEVSSHALYLDRVWGIEYDMAVFTNITQDHLDFHKNMTEYFATKTKLFADLGNYSAKNHPKYAIINIDDSYSRLLIEKTSNKVITYGVKEQADVMARNIDITPGGVSMEVVSPWGDIKLDLNMTGMFTVYNVLAAVTVALAEGVEKSIIKTALEGVKGVDGRFELVDAGQNFSVIVDYAHTPDSLENVLKTSREFVQGRLITVFGCGGDRDKGKRPLMGAVSAKYSDYSILTSDNPRTEEPLEILKSIEEGIKPLVTKDQYTVIPERREAIKHAIAMAQKGDIVMIAGKGHETYQIIGNQVLPFDDRVEARSVLEQLQRRISGHQEPQKH